MDIDLHDIGCDFYTSSGQKWILGPREASFVYVKKDAQAELWPNIVTVGWERSKANGAQKYESLGQRESHTFKCLQSRQKDLTVVFLSGLSPIPTRRKQPKLYMRNTAFRGLLAVGMMYFVCAYARIFTIVPNKWI